jgi:hypothetical protein
MNDNNNNNKHIKLQVKRMQLNKMKLEIKNRAYEISFRPMILVIWYR